MGSDTLADGLAMTLGKLIESFKLVKNHLNRAGYPPISTSIRGYLVTVKFDKKWLSGIKASVQIEPSERPDDPKPIYARTGDPVEECARLFSDFFRARQSLSRQDAEWLTSIGVRPSIGSLYALLKLNKERVTSLQVGDTTKPEPFGTEEEEAKRNARKLAFSVQIRDLLAKRGIPVTSQTQIEIVM